MCEQKTRPTCPQPAARQPEATKAVLCPHAVIQGESLTLCEAQPSPLEIGPTTCPASHRRRQTGKRSVDSNAPWTLTLRGQGVLLSL